MTRSTLVALTTRTAASLVGAAILGLSLAGTASAREGSSSKSIGGGIKCSNVTIRNADGSYTVTQVCRKGV